MASRNRKWMLIASVTMLMFIACFATVMSNESHESDAVTLTKTVTIGDTWTNEQIIIAPSGPTFSGEIPGITLTTQIRDSNMYWVIGSGTFTTAGIYVISTSYGEAIITVNKKTTTDTNEVWIGEGYSWGNSELSSTTPTITGSVPGITWTTGTVNNDIKYVEAKGTFTTAGSYTVTVEFEKSKHILNFTIIDPTVYVTSVSISGSSEVEIGSTITLTATTSPSNADNRYVTWSITGTNIASKQSTTNTTTGGKIVIKGLAAGTATIKATAADGSGAYDEFNVTVVKPPVLVSSITISGLNEVEVGSSITLTGVSNPSNADDRSISWYAASGGTHITKTSRNTSSGGTLTITGQSAGAVRIYAMANDESGTTSDYYDITVVEPVIKVTNITISGKNSGPQTDAILLTPTITPSNATYQTLNWTISEGEGNITVRDDGTALVTGTTLNVKVRAIATDGSEVYGEKTLTFYPVYTVTFDANGGSCSTQSAKWYQTADPIILPEATYSSDYNFMGWFTMTSGGVKVGTSGDEYTPVTSTTLYAQWEEKRVPVTSIVIDGSQAVNVDQTITLSALAYPEDATERGVTWSVESGSEYVELSGIVNNSSGGTVNVKGIAPGTATIKVTAKDGSGVSQLYEVTVEEDIVTYTMSITYDGKGGQNIPENRSFTEQTTETITITVSELVPTKEGYTFEGWETEEGSGVVAYRPGNEITLRAGEDLKLFAVWKTIQKTYILTFDPSPGTNGPDQMEELDAASSHTFTIPMTIPVRDGYRFVGWSNVENSVSATCFAGGSFTADGLITTLYAVWEEDIPESEFILFFDMQGGEGGPGEMKVIEIARTHDFTIPINVPTKTDYIFMGWAQYPGSSDLYRSSGEIITCNPGTTYLYAIWELAERDWYLSYNTGIGVNGPDDVHERSASLEYTFTVSDVIPTWTHHIFKGWSTEEGSAVATFLKGDDFTTSEKYNILYAVWEEEPKDTFNVHFNLDGGQGNIVLGPFTGYDTYGAIVPLDEPTKSGCDFLGWATESGGDVRYLPGDQITLVPGDTILYAIWDEYANYWLLFYLLGGEGGPTSQSGKGEDGGYDFLIPDDEPARAGYLFLGWSTSPGGELEYAAGMTYHADSYGTYNLYAVWEQTVFEKTYTLMFDANGGSGAPEPMSESTMESYVAFKIPDDGPARTGYRFVGWSTSQDGSPSISAGGIAYVMDSNSVDGTRTLYAVWEPFIYSTYVLILDANGGSGAPVLEPKTSSEGSVTFTLPMAKPTKDGYRFVGWSTTSTGDAVYDPGDNVSVGADTTPLRLYAVWQKDSGTSLEAHIQIKVSGMEVSYDASASSGFTSVLWSFGDGTTSEQVSGKHIYDNAGNYIVKLVVYDGDGHSMSAPPMSVTISEENDYNPVKMAMVAVVSILVLLGIVRFIGLV